MKDSEATTTQSAFSVCENYETLAVGDCVAKKFLLLRRLGQGTFGTIFEARASWDIEHVVLKVVGPQKRHVEDARDEAKILSRIKQLDRLDEFSIVRSYSHFAYNGLYVISMEKLGVSVYHLLGKNKFKGMCLEDIRAISHQILVALEFLHRNKIIHTDLKPENILFRTFGLRYDRDLQMYRSHSNKIKLIDFGGACIDELNCSRPISSRPYKSPEVLRGRIWSFSTDLWSVGCIIFEMYSGISLFSAEDDNSHLKQIRSLHTKAVQCEPALQDLLNKLLEVDPVRRLTAKEALLHHFFVH